MTTYFEFTVKVPTQQVQDTVEYVWNKAFTIPSRSYNENLEYGYREVERQVKDYINQLDLTDRIQNVTNGVLNGAVQDAVEVVLKEYAKKRAREMLKDGTLLGGST